MSEPLAILFQSADLVVVDKPAGIATEPDKSGGESLRDRVHEWLRARTGGAARSPHAVSRLDTNVSGAVTFALSDLGKKRAAEAQQRGHIDRRYLAISAPLEPARGRWVSPIGGKSAATRFTRVAEAAGRAALLLLEPETGRTHQLRIHAGGAGAAILGDGRYGGQTTISDASGRVRRVDRVLLHAAAVRVDLGLPSDPAGFVLAPIPAALIEAWQTLDGAPEAWNEAVAACAGSS